MPSLVSDSEKAILVSVFRDMFDTFKRTITVHKEPVKVFNQVTNQPMAGYGEDSDESNVTFVPQKQDFFAVISYANQQNEVATQVGSYEVGTVRVKVEADAAEYIKTGKVERIEIDGKSFNKITEDKVSDFLTVRYHVFYLRATT